MEPMTGMWLALALLAAALGWALWARRAERAGLEQAREAARVETAELRLAAARQEEVIKARDAALAQHGREVEALREKLAGAEGTIGNLRVELRELQTTLEKERQAAEEKIKLLGSVREDMENRFKQLAEELIRKHGEDLSKTNREKLEALLTPFREHVGRFEEELRNVHLGAAKERERLKTEIEQLTRRSEEISREAVNLTRALRGEKQRQGAWGEMVLASLLENSGLRAGEEYEVQAHRRGEDGQRYRPDVVVRLPGDKRLVIDSKVSLVAYETAVNAEDETERQEAARAHVRAVRAHIDALAARGYQQLEDGSVDYVVMFMPIEGALSEALREQGDLTSYALGRGVTIATPTTLMMALRTIEHVWAVERRNRNAEAIADRAGKLYDKVAGFVEEMEKVGLRLDQAQLAHGTAMDRLARGRGNVLAQIEQLKSLGAKTSKAIAAASLEAADEEVSDGAGEADAAAGGEDNSEGEGDAAGPPRAVAAIGPSRD